jgi:homeobox protein cut-like
LFQLNPIPSIPSIPSSAHLSNGTNGSSSDASAPTEGTQDGLSGLNLGASLTAQEAQGLDARTPLIPFPGPSGSTADTSILPIVTNQRDRFRQRNAELEEVGVLFAFASVLCKAYLLNNFTFQEVRKQSEIVTELRSDIKSLQQDNLKLYEKVRYIQSYREDDLTSSVGAGPSNTSGRSQFVPGPSNSIPLQQMRAPLDEISKYKSMYEEKMNPFEQFRGRVRIHFLSMRILLLLIRAA